MDQGLKVLHVIGNLETGGAEKLLVDTLPLINVNRKITADLLLFDGRETPFMLLLKQRGIDVRHLGRMLYNPLFVFKLMPYLRKYDLVHVHLFPAQYIVVLAKILSFSPTKLLFTEHSTGNKRMNHPLFKMFDKFIYRFYSQVICISEQVKEVLIKNLKLSSNKLSVLQNGVDNDFIQKAVGYDRVDHHFSKGDVLIIMVAGFRIEKDQNTVIKALSNLPGFYKVILVGSGKTLSESKNLTDFLNLTNRVFFYGIRTDVYSLMKMCDIAVLSSHWEGFGLSAIESMACGLPTIVSNVSGLAQIVGDAGLNFEKGNVEQLATQIKKIWESKITYNQLVVRGIARAKEFDISLMIKNQIRLYNIIMMEKNK